MNDNFACEWNDKTQRVLGRCSGVTSRRSVFLREVFASVLIWNVRSGKKIHEPNPLSVSANLNVYSQNQDGGAQPTDTDSCQKLKIWLLHGWLLRHPASSLLLSLSFLPPFTYQLGFREHWEQTRASTDEGKFVVPLMLADKDNEKSEENFCKVSPFWPNNVPNEYTNKKSVENRWIGRLEIVCAMKARVNLSAMPVRDKF